MLDQDLINLSAYRLEKAADLLAQSEYLLVGKYYDGSINRSYYAVFNAIRSLLALLELDSSKHSGVLSFFDLHFVKTGLLDKKWSKIAHSAFDARQISDYKDKPKLTEEQAVEQLKATKALLAEIQQLHGKLIVEQLPLPQAK